MYNSISAFCFHTDANALAGLWQGGQSGGAHERAIRLDCFARSRNARDVIVGAGLCNLLTIIRLKVLRRCVGRGKPWHPTLTLPLSTAEPRLYYCS
eukprot:4219071-Pleurochrysis_carterae.AAC.1